MAKKDDPENKENPETETRNWDDPVET